MKQLCFLCNSNLTKKELKASGHGQEPDSFLCFTCLSRIKSQVFGEVYHPPKKDSDSSEKTT